MITIFFTTTHIPTTKKAKQTKCAAQITALTIFACFGMFRRSAPNSIQQQLTCRRCMVPENPDKKAMIGKTKELNTEVSMSSFSEIKSLTQKVRFKKQKVTAEIARLTVALWNLDPDTTCLRKI
mmetsp:Transcript_33942/g.44783  ORF Transcript_33942/g.44783 Transcript_33942/m.44783 type:complete len:124 (-) Transcript_33942:273-644(-)